MKPARAARAGPQFAPAIEQRYQNDLVPDKLAIFVRTNIVAAILFAAWGLFDPFTMSQGVAAAWMVRLAMVVLNLGCALLALRQRALFARHYTAWVSGIYLCWGLAMEAIIALAAPGDLAWTAYYAGLILMTFGLYSRTYLNAVPALAVGGFYVLTYWILTLQVGQIGARKDLLVLLTSSFFLVSANVVGLLSLHTRDRLARRAFLLQLQLKGDIAHGAQAVREQQHVARHDPLTGLLNRHGFQQRLDELLASTADGQNVLAVIFIDLDDFKPVNDSYGHAAGDAVLRAVAERLRAALRATDVVARVGGDEFIAALVLAEPHGPALRKLCAALEHGVTQPLVWEGQVLAVQASLGSATSSEFGADAAALVARADERMYAHKRQHKAARRADGATRSR